ncbi:MAG: hypothetical protein ACPGWR_16445 [Ardenticatenaceae bacterium]
MFRKPVTYIVHCALPIATRSNDFSRFRPERLKSLLRMGTIGNLSRARAVLFFEKRCSPQAL